MIGRRILLFFFCFALYETPQQWIIGSKLFNRRWCLWTFEPGYLWTDSLRSILWEMVDANVFQPVGLLGNDSTQRCHRHKRFARRTSLTFMRGLWVIKHEHFIKRRSYMSRWKGASTWRGDQLTQNQPQPRRCMRGKSVFAAFSRSFCSLHGSLPPPQGPSKTSWWHELNGDWLMSPSVWCLLW